jgi:hypothetical protein
VSELLAQIGHARLERLGKMISASFYVQPDRVRNFRNVLFLGFPELGDDAASQCQQVTVKSGIEILTTLALP